MEIYQPSRFKEGEVFYSDWFPREADNAIFRLEGIDAGGTSPSLKVEFYTKNADATSSYDGTIISGKDCTVTGQAYDQDIVVSSTTGATGLKELVRLKYTMTGSGSAWILARMLPTVFFDSGDGSTT